jgi:hypothetical protein
MTDIPEQLEKFYKSLEKIESYSIWNILREVKPLNEIDKNWEEEILIERKIFNYNINKGEIVPNSHITDINGKAIEISLNTKELEYLKKRVQVTQNTWLLSRYTHLLWQQTRHNNYANLALRNYYLSVNKISTEEARELAICLSAILYISKKTKQNIEKSRELSLYLIEKFPVWYKPNLLKVTLEDSYLTNQQLLQVSNNINNWINFDTGVDYFNNKEILELSLKIFETIKKPNIKLYELLARNEDLVLQQHPLDTDFVKYTSIGAKAKYLLLAKNKIESEKCFKEYNRLKQTIKLGKVSTELEDKETELLNEYLNEKTEFILQLSTNEILYFFSKEEDILVNLDIVNEFSIENIKKSSMNVLNVSGFDINSNFKKLNESDKIQKEINQNYSITHTIKCETLFIKVFVKGIIQGKLNYYKVYEYLQEHTWFGEKFNRSMTTKEIDKNSSWLSMLAPGIHNLFSQFELSVLMSTNQINNFILAIDSLTLKFEGAIRDFIRLSGGNTSTSKRGEIKEQLLEELLENEIIHNQFSKKDIELFKYTFTNKGKNIRNNIAHSFYQYSDYTMQKAMLIFFCILRLGKFQVTKKTSN